MLKATVVDEEKFHRDVSLPGHAPFGSPLSKAAPSVIALALGISGRAAR